MLVKLHFILSGLVIQPSIRSSKEYNLNILSWTSATHTKRGALSKVHTQQAMNRGLTQNWTFDIFISAFDFTLWSVRGSTTMKVGAWIHHDIGGCQ